MNKLSLTIASVAMMTLIATTACVAKEVPAIESSNKTEIKKVPYTTIEEYQQTTPHPTNLVHATWKEQTPPFFFLFNWKKNDLVSCIGLGSSTKTIQIKPSGQNQRLAVSASATITQPLTCSLKTEQNIQLMFLTGRDPQAIALGFNEDKPLLEKAIFVPDINQYNWREIACGKAWNSTTVLKLTEPASEEKLRSMIEENRLSGISEWDILNKDIYFMSGPFDKQLRNLIKAGYQYPRSTIIKEIQINQGTSSVELSLDEIMSKDKWVLLWLDSFPISSSMNLTMDIDYVYYSTETGTRQVTKYLEVPVPTE